jgi:hypothetical protein
MNGWIKIRWSIRSYACSCTTCIDRPSSARNLEAQADDLDYFSNSGAAFASPKIPGMIDIENSPDSTSRTNADRR